MTEEAVNSASRGVGSDVGGPTGEAAKLTGQGCR
jgi:hypothetical protein